MHCARPPHNSNIYGVRKKFILISSLKIKTQKNFNSSEELNESTQEMIFRRDRTNGFRGKEHIFEASMGWHPEIRVLLV